MSIHGKMVLNKHFSLNFGLVCKKEMQFIWLEIVQKDYLKMLWVMIRSQVIKNKIKKKTSYFQYIDPPTDDGWVKLSKL